MVYFVRHCASSHAYVPDNCHSVFGSTQPLDLNSRFKTGLPIDFHHFYVSGSIFESYLYHLKSKSKLTSDLNLNLYHSTRAFRSAVS